MAFVSGGATKRCIESIGAVAHRRFFFWFKTSDELKVVLYLSYYARSEHGAGREFFADSSRFSAAERIRPDQAVVKPDSTMDVDEGPVRVAFFGHDLTAFYA